MMRGGGEPYTTNEVLTRMAEAVALLTNAEQERIRCERERSNRELYHRFKPEGRLVVVSGGGS